MLQDKMGKLVKGTLSAGAITALIIALVCLASALFIWTINSLAEAGGSAFRLEHSIWTYFLAILFLALVRGGKS